MGPDQFSLEWLIAPLTRYVFEREHWEQRPLLLQRHRNSYFEGLFTLADFDRLLSGPAAASSDVRLVGDGKQTDQTSQRRNLEDIYAQYRAGNSIVWSFIQN